MSSTPQAAVPRIRSLERVVDAQWFQLFISGVIVLNAIVLGAETYVDPASPTFTMLMRLNDAFYLVFLAELILRIVSYGRQPWNFFRSG